MADTYLRNGVRDVVASIPQADHDQEECVAVIINGARVPWFLRFYARLGSNRIFIGGVRIFASRQNRLVAVLAVPGCRSFEVEGRADDSTIGDVLEVDFEGVPGRGGPWGVTAIPGNSVFGGRSYQVLTGAGGGPITCTGEVHGWTAYTTLAGGTVTVTGPLGLTLGPIIVPQNGSVSGDAMGLLAPVSIWTFANVQSYVIEYIPPGVEMP